MNGFARARLLCPAGLRLRRNPFVGSHPTQFCKSCLNETDGSGSSQHGQQEHHDGGGFGGHCKAGRGRSSARRDGKRHANGAHGVTRPTNWPSAKTAALILGLRTTQPCRETMAGDLAGDITRHFDGMAVTVSLNACQSLAAGVFSAFENKLLFVGLSRYCFKTLIASK
jgi:hypothetical protein